MREANPTAVGIDLQRLPRQWLTRFAVLSAVVGAQVVVAWAWLPRYHPIPFYWERFLTAGFYAVPRLAVNGWVWSAAGALAALSLLVLLVPMVVERRKGKALLVLLTVYGAAAHLLLAAVGLLGSEEWLGTLYRPEEPASIAERVTATGRAAFLEVYVDLQRGEELPLHARTHPPGYSLLFSWLSPPLTGYALAAFLALLVTASVWPLHALARRLMDEASALVCCIYWVLCPSLALLTPTCTDALTASAALFVAAAVAAAAARDSRPMMVGVGVLYGLSALLSFFFVPLALVYASIVYALGRRAHVGRSLALAAAGAAGVLLALYLATGFSYLACWSVAREHVQHDFIRLNRSFLLIVLNGPVFLAGLGLSVAALLLCGRAKASGALAVVRLAAVVTLLVVAVLVRGEVERVFLPLMPFLILSALLPVTRLSEEARLRLTPLLATVAGLLACQDIAVQTLFDPFW